MREEVHDVVVVGGGGAGLAAAIEARAAGRTVLLLEKNAALGGSTAWSIGSVTATQTPHQKKRGIVDNPADHWADMPGFAGELASRVVAGGADLAACTARTAVDKTARRDGARHPDRRAR